MKNLKFNVSGDRITPDPKCDFSGLYPRMTEPVRLEFSFSPEWKNMVKVAAFWSAMGREYSPRVIKDDLSCIVPTEALQNEVFRVQILGKQNGKKTSTSKHTVFLKGDST